MLLKDYYHSTKMKRKLLSGLLIISVLFISACQSNNRDSEKKSITVSILPQKYFVQSLIGDKLNINVMVAPGASPASYEPTPRQMAELTQSDLYLMMGHLGFEEAWIPRIEKTNPDLKIIDLSSGITLLGEESEEEHGADESDEHHHGVDPHIWMSPKQAKKIVQNTASALIKYEESCKDLILQKRDSLIGLIDDLDQRYSAAMDLIQNRKFIIFHPALTYLANDYQLEQIAMEFEGKEPSPSYFKSIVDRAKSENIGLLFIQKEFDIENAKQMAREIGAELIQIDPLDEDWFEQMEDILEKLKMLDKRAG